MCADKWLIRKGSMEKLFDILIQENRTIYAPARENGRISFRPAKAFSGIDGDYIQTIQSPKDIAFPRTEKVLDYTKNQDGISVKGIDINAMPEVVLWGAKPCDAAGLKTLSSVFNKDYTDGIFNSRCSRVTVLAFSCHKYDEYCFCTSVGGHPGSTAGSDILFTRLGESGNYLAEVMTEKGSSVLSLARRLFEKAGDIRKEEYLADVPVKFSRETVRERLEKYFGSIEWKEQSLKCLGCGACAYVCPVCSCFDIQDESHGKTGMRLRCWDSCGFAHFTIHTSGHNPREVQSKRWRQRLMHKFSYMPDRLSTFGCTGCGRCSRACPADMNILEILTSIQEAAL